MKIAFTTSLFGCRRFDPYHFKCIDQFDYFLFSDRDQSDFNTSWKVYNISKNPNILNLNCNVRKSRYAKFMGWELFKSMGLKYDVIYYCDSHWRPKHNADFLSFSKKLVKCTFPFFQEKHPFCHSGGILDECNLIIDHHKDSKKQIQKTISFFKTQYPNISLSAKQYYENTVFAYSPVEQVKKITKDFWSIYSQNDISFRDQPTWNLMLLKYKLHPHNSPHVRSMFERCE